MAVAWTTIPAGDVDVDSPVTTALMASLRDNPEGIAQRATGAPKIFGVPYDFQEFLASGPPHWVKPTTAETGDRVIVQVVGGGGSGGRHTDFGGSGGGGGAGATQFFDDIDDLGATETIVVGAGAAGQTGNGLDGGDSSFGTASTDQFVFGGGGQNGIEGTFGTDEVGGDGGFARHFLTGISTAAGFNKLHGGAGGHSDNDTDGTNRNGEDSILGGGGGGGTKNDGPVGSGGVSSRAGYGGLASITTDGSPGAFPGGGGGGTNTGSLSGAGANGVIRVWCIKED